MAGRGGAVVMVRNSAVIEVEIDSLELDEVTARLVASMTVMTDLGEMLLVSVYMPCCRYVEQENIIRALSRAIQWHLSQGTARIVIGGDFNNIQDPYFDVLAGTPSPNPLERESRSLLGELICHYGLVDTMRYLNEFLRHGTNTSHGVSRRLDRIYVDQSLKSHIYRYYERKNDLTSTHVTVCTSLMIDKKSAVRVGQPRFITPNELLTQSTLRKFERYTDFDNMVYDCRKKMQRISYVVKRLETCQIKLMMKGMILRKRVILELKDGDSVADNTDSIIDMATTFWSKQYEDLGDPPESEYLDLPAIEAEDAFRLDRPFTQDELYSCLQTKSDSAPGEDGLTYKFWKATWDMYGEMLTKTANGLMEGIIPNSMTTILLTMIPKVPNSNEIKNFRPIALINTSLRLICQAINERLLLVADQLIGPYQTGFIKDRHIHNNILLFQSVLHLWCRKDLDLGPTRAWAWPEVRLQDPDLAAAVIDFQKAFDLINQKYIGKCLEKTDIPPRLRTAIMTILRAQHAQVYINNVKGPRFPMRRGTMQGNPFSPFLFILGMEQLLRNLSKIKGMCLTGRHSFDPTPIKVMAFADDLIVFMSDEDRPVVKECLEAFSYHSGCKVNKDKSLVLVIDEDHPDRCPYLDFPVNTVAELSNMKYLGVTIGPLDWKKECRNLLGIIHGKDELLPSRLGKAVNTFLLSKLYYRDIHSPMHQWDISHFTNEIGRKLFYGIGQETIFTRNELGGYGVLLLDRQLLGRRAQVVHEAIFGKEWHHRLFRLTIQHWATWAIRYREMISDSDLTIPWYEFLLGRTYVRPTHTYHLLDKSLQKEFSKLMWACIKAWVELTGMKQGDPIEPYQPANQDFEKLVEPYLGDLFNYDPEIFHSVSKKSPQTDRLLRTLDEILRPSDRKRLPKFWKQMSKQLHVHDKPYDYLHMFHNGNDMRAISQAKNCLLCGRDIKTLHHTFFQCRIACQVWQYAGLRGLPEISKLVGVCGQPQDKFCSYMRRLLKARVPNHAQAISDLELRSLLRYYESLYCKQY
ncbi:hypothetical protein PUMCH_000005 [Australozyma saopauloensis]|uniref:Reverse transcriptase domain-containing protein n=1 Tax=Australozyma saopauloensis TaxID=291208 RepID=A0AAX4H2S0_9ASCO|nr:hypothetical protein PUMCH_000005 [[Candida] saopauloensis]